MKSKLLQVLIWIILIGSIIFTSRSCVKQKELLKKATRNIEILHEDIISYTTKNGKQASTIDGLQLDINSLEKINKNLFEDLTASNVKLSNVKSVIEVVTEYKYINTLDTLYVKVTDSTVLLNVQEQYLHLKAEIDIKKQLIYPSSLILEIPNTQTISTEVLTKGWWLFKRDKGVRVTVINSNPYLRNSNIFYVELSK